MKSDARSSLNVSVNRILVPTPENVSKTALRAQNPALDTRSCGEISCDECNERFTALQAENQQLRNALQFCLRHTDGYAEILYDKEFAAARAALSLPKGDSK